jgi:hypothetical protein
MTPQQARPESRLESGLVVERPGARHQPLAKLGDLSGSESRRHAPLDSRHPHAGRIHERVGWSAALMVASSARA